MFGTAPVLRPLPSGTGYALPRSAGSLPPNTLPPPLTQALPESRDQVVSGPAAWPIFGEEDEPPLYDDMYLRHRLVQMEKKFQEIENSLMVESGNRISFTESINKAHANLLSAVERVDREVATIRKAQDLFSQSLIRRCDEVEAAAKEATVRQAGREDRFLADIRGRFDSLEVRLQGDLTKEISMREADIFELRTLLGGSTMAAAMHHKSVLEIVNHDGPRNAGPDLLEIADMQQTSILEHMHGMERAFKEYYMKSVEVKEIFHQERVDREASITKEHDSLRALIAEVSTTAKDNLAQETRAREMHLNKQLDMITREVSTREAQHASVATSLSYLEGLLRETAQDHKNDMKDAENKSSMLRAVVDDNFLAMKSEVAAENDRIHGNIATLEKLILSTGTSQQDLQKEVQDKHNRLLDSQVALFDRMTGFEEQSRTEKKSRELGIGELRGIIDKEQAVRVSHQELHTQHLSKLDAFQKDMHRLQEQVKGETSTRHADINGLSDFLFGHNLAGNCHQGSIQEIIDRERNHAERRERDGSLQLPRSRSMIVEGEVLPTISHSPSSKKDSFVSSLVKMEACMRQERAHREADLMHIREVVVGELAGHGRARSVVHLSTDARRAAFEDAHPESKASVPRRVQTKIFSDAEEHAEEEVQDRHVMEEHMEVDAKGILHRLCLIELQMSKEGHKRGSDMELLRQEMEEKAETAANKLLEEKNIREADVYELRECIGGEQLARQGHHSTVQELLEQERRQHELHAAKSQEHADHQHQLKGHVTNILEQVSSIQDRLEAIDAEVTTRRRDFNGLTKFFFGAEMADNCHPHTVEDEFHREIAKSGIVSPRPSSPDDESSRILASRSGRSFRSVASEGAAPFQEQLQTADAESGQVSPNLSSKASGSRMGPRVSFKEQANGASAGDAPFQDGTASIGTASNGVRSRTTTDLRRTMTRTLTGMSGRRAGDTPESFCVRFARIEAQLAEEAAFREADIYELRDIVGGSELAEQPHFRCLEDAIVARRGGGEGPEGFVDASDVEEGADDCLHKKLELVAESVTRLDQKMTEAVNERLADVFQLRLLVGGEELAHSGHSRSIQELLNAEKQHKAKDGTGKQTLLGEVAEMHQSLERLDDEGRRRAADLRGLRKLLGGDQLASMAEEAEAAGGHPHVSARDLVVRERSSLCRPKDKGAPTVSNLFGEVAAVHETLERLEQVVSTEKEMREGDLEQLKAALGGKAFASGNGASLGQLLEEAKTQPNFQEGGTGVGGTLIAEVAGLSNSLRRLQEGLSHETNVREADVHELREIVGGERMARQGHYDSVQELVEAERLSREQHVKELANGAVHQATHVSGLMERLDNLQAELKAESDGREADVFELRTIIGGEQFAHQGHHKTMLELQDSLEREKRDLAHRIQETDDRLKRDHQHHAETLLQRIVDLENGDAALEQRLASEEDARKAAIQQESKERSAAISRVADKFSADLTMMEANIYKELASDLTIDPIYAKAAKDVFGDHAPEPTLTTTHKTVEPPPKVPVASATDRFSSSGTSSTGSSLIGSQRQAQTWATVPQQHSVPAVRPTAVPSARAPINYPGTVYAPPQPQRGSQIAAHGFLTQQGRFPQ